MALVLRNKQLLALIIIALIAVAVIAFFVPAMIAHVNMFHQTVWGPSGP